LNFSVRRFLLRNGVDASEGDVNAVIKRLDTDRDSRVFFPELKRLFSFPSVGLKESNLRTSGGLSRSTERRSFKKLRKFSSS
jgi:hypothetical protein